MGGNAALSSKLVSDNKEKPSILVWDNKNSVKGKSQFMNIKLSIHLKSFI